MFNLFQILSQLISNKIIYVIDIGQWKISVRTNDSSFSQEETFFAAYTGMICSQYDTSRP